MNKLVLFIGAAVLLGSLSSCKKYKNKEVYANVPVYMSYADFRSSFEYIDGIKPMAAPGNIFIHNDFIFVSDEDRGIHIVNNSNKSAPYFVGFMNIPGNTQLAVKDDILYANSFVDLLTIDISTISNPQLVNRMYDVFSYSLPAVDDEYPTADISKDKGVVIDWKIEKTKDVSGFGSKLFAKDCAKCQKEEMQTKSSSSIRVNLAGSRSQFAIIENHLYAIDKGSIKSFNISSSTNPTFAYEKRTWDEPETLFPEGNYLFVGTTTGMKIYDTGSDRDNPKFVSEIEHVESCDPVVVQGNYAYLTLRSGSDCGGDVNELQVIDVGNLKFPQLEEQFEMSDPHGLAVDGNLLFVCDGSDGLKVYNNSNPLNSGDNLMYHYSGIQTSDIILNNGAAIMIAEEGVYQYDYTNPSNLTMISLLSF